MSLPPSYKSMSDGELVLLFQQGDPLGEGAPAFEELVRRYRRLVWSRAFRIADGYYPDPADTADDVEAETFVTVYEKLRTLESPGSFKTWLYRITTNTSYDRLRRDRRRLMDQSLDEMVENGHLFRSELTGGPDKDVLVRELWNLLTPLERLVLIMRFVEGRTLDEIADALGKVGTGRHVPVSRDILNPCLHKLRKVLRSRRP